ncbi:MAG: phenylalanine--tRNA ligase subunit beta [Longimicrobiales bacterium]
MKFSEKWLRSIVPIDLDQAQLIERLTMGGLEVESTETIGANIDGVVVGEIVEVAPHPAADRLQVCSVNIGAAEHVQVVCGAPNARVGLRAPLAPVGTRMPDGLEIKAATLRGVESFGMLCSARELGIDADASGLLELPVDAIPGASLAAALSLPDTVLELKLTPNRADCFGMEGLAAEIGALCGREWQRPAIAEVPATTAAIVTATLNAGDACPRYLSRVVEGVDAGAATPAWMRERLVCSGFRPVNAVVDAGNFVMLETGQPTHVFDRGQLGEGLQVRFAIAGEKVHLLDGKEVEASPDALLVADRRAPLGLAGVMGGFAARVTDATKDLLIEAAHFAPAAIAGQARKFALSSEAAHRFERGVDPELPRRAIERLTGLVLEICGGRAGPISEAVLPAALPTPLRIPLRLQRISRVLGISPGAAEVERILGALGMRFETDAAGWQVIPPSRRFDLAIEEDLIEEIARVVGYHAIPARVPEGAISAPSLQEGRLGPSALADALRHRGYTEALNFSFVDAHLLRRWGLDADAVHLANPLSAELSVMRTALLPGLVETLSRNLARQQARVRLFEVGRVFAAAGEGVAPIETVRIAGCSSGAAAAEQWGNPTRPMDFHDIKGDVEQMLALAGIVGSRLHFGAGAPAWLHPGRSATLEDSGRAVGWLGALSPTLQRSLGLDAETFAFEFDVEPLLARAIPRATELSKYPSVRRDLALIVAEDVPFAHIEASVREAAGPLLREVVLFDRFVGADLPPGCKSVAIGLILQEPSRTLAEQDVVGAVASVVAALERGLGARLRG